MTTKDLANALPEIITKQVPGPKSKALLDRRDAAIPQLLISSQQQSLLAVVFQYQQSQQEQRLWMQLQPEQSVVHSVVTHLLVLLR